VTESLRLSAHQTAELADDRSPEIFHVWTRQGKPAGTEPHAARELEEFVASLCCFVS